MKSESVDTLIHRAPEPLLVIISGPSGVGKDTVLMRMRELGFPFHFVVTANSRPRRVGEIDGVDYHFITPERFEEMIAKDELLEWATVYDQYKGVPKSEVRRALDSGRDVIMRVNVDGATKIRAIVPQAVLIFILPSSIAELRRRLELRHTDPPPDIERRLAKVPEEMAFIPQFDYVVPNHEDRLDETVGAIRAIVTSEKLRVNPRKIEL